MTIEVGLSPFGQAWIESYSPNEVSLRSAQSFPPGATFSVTYDSLILEIKVRSCRRHGDEFVVSGRWVNLRREALQRLEQATSKPPQP